MIKSPLSSLLQHYEALPVPPWPLPDPGEGLPLQRRSHTLHASVLPIHSLCGFTTHPLPFPVRLQPRSLAQEPSPEDMPMEAGRRDAGFPTPRAPKKTMRWGRQRDSLWVCKGPHARYLKGKC